MKAKTIVQYNHKVYIVTVVGDVSQGDLTYEVEVEGKKPKVVQHPRGYISYLGELYLREGWVKIRPWPFKPERAAVEWICPTIIRSKKNDLVVQIHDFDTILLEW
jgi:hypothetical protein